MTDHMDALRESLVTEHEAYIAEVQQWADDAAAAGDAERERRHRAHVERLRAMPYPGEHSAAA